MSEVTIEVLLGDKKLPMRSCNIEYLHFSHKWLSVFGRSGREYLINESITTLAYRLGMLMISRCNAIWYKDIDLIEGGMCNCYVQLKSGRRLRVSRRRADWLKDYREPCQK